MEVKKSKFGFILLCTTLILGVVLYDFISKVFHFTFIDELITFVLFAEWFFNGKKQKEFFFFLCIALFYLLYSLFFPMNVKNAILVDFFIQVKPFIAFYATYNLTFSFSKSQRQFLCKLCTFFAVSLLLIGVAGILGSGTMYDLCGHPSRFATMCTAVAMTYLYFSPDTVHSKIKSLLFLMIGLLSLRSKIFGFFPIFVLIIFFGDKMVRKFHFLSIKTIAIFSILILAGLFFAWDKFEFYFIYGSSHDIENMFARPLMYQKAIEILKDYPLLGTGLGSYGTYASAIYYSPLYTKYGLIYNYSIGRGMFISDAFYPSLAQFGLIGISLFFTFWKKRVQESIKIMRQFHSPFTFQFIALLTIFFIIESVADSTFTHNRGMYMLMLMAVCLKNPPKESWD